MQIESSLAGWSLVKAGGTRTSTASLGSSVIKLGLGDRSDLQIGWSPFVRVTSRGAGKRSVVRGVGDVVVRYKHRLTGESDKAQVVIIPFVKLPTAPRRLGNGRAEGGLAVPLSFALAGPVTMTLGPEIDVLADAEGSGRHLAIVNLAGPIAPRLTLAGELFSNINFERGETIRQTSVDIAVAYAVTDSLQLDAGSNFGLNRNTPDAEVYMGVSMRF